MNEPTQSNTPRADAIAKRKHVPLIGDVEFVPAIIARQLERELNQTGSRSLAHYNQLKQGEGK